MTTPALNNSSEFRDSLYLKARKFKFENKFRKSIRYVVNMICKLDNGWKER